MVAHVAQALLTADVPVLLPDMVLEVALPRHDLLWQNATACFELTLDSVVQRLQTNALYRANGLVIYQDVLWRFFAEVGVV